MIDLDGGNYLRSYVLNRREEHIKNKVSKAAYSIDQGPIWAHMISYINSILIEKYISNIFR